MADTKIKEVVLDETTVIAKSPIDFKINIEPIPIAPIKEINVELVERKENNENAKASNSPSDGKTSSNGKYIKKAMRIAIQEMACVAQLATIVDMMPRPIDFITRTTGEVVTLSGKIMKVQAKLNAMLDVYQKIPTEYFIGIADNIFDQAGSIVNNTFATGQKYLNVATDAVDSIGTAADAAMEFAKSQEQIISDLASTAGQVTSIATGNLDTAETINEWVEGINDSAINAMTQTQKRIQNTLGYSEDGGIGAMDAMQVATDAVAKAQDKTNAYMDKARDKVKDSILYLQKAMDKLSSVLEDGFGQVIPTDKLKSISTKLSSSVNENDSATTVALLDQAVAVSDTMTTAIENFNIGKITSAAIGFTAQCGIAALGLDNLPKIDIEGMLKFAAGEVVTNLTNKAISKKYGVPMSVDGYNDNGTQEIDDDQFEITVPEGYESIKKEVEEDLKTQRRNLMLKRAKKNKHEKVAPEDKEKDEEKRKQLKSLARKIREEKRLARAAKLAETTKATIKAEMEYLKRECENFKTEIVREWNTMLSQYRDSAAQIKDFFTKGSGKAEIDKKCDQIENGCVRIKEAFKQIAKDCAMNALVPVIPAVIGSAVDNPAYKLIVFVLKVKELFERIKHIIDIFTQEIITPIEDLAHLILNGLNSFKDIFNQLFELLGIKPIMDLINKLVEIFGKNCAAGKEVLENTISPVLYKETDEYNSKLEELMEAADIAEENDDEQLLISICGDEDADDEDAQKGQLGLLEEREDEIVAYKSPLMNDDGTEIKAWIFYHPNLNHITRFSNPKFIRSKVKNKYIVKAAQNGNKKRGGKNMLIRKNLTTGSQNNINTLTLEETGELISNQLTNEDRLRSAYNGFYWYTKYTDDVSDDCIDDDHLNDPTNTDEVRRVTQTSEGSLVEVTDPTTGATKRVFVPDATVKSGDYIQSEGKVYKVK